MYLLSTLFGQLDWHCVVSHIVIFRPGMHTNYTQVGLFLDEAVQSVHPAPRKGRAEDTSLKPLDWVSVHSRPFTYTTANAGRQGSVCECEIHVKSVANVGLDLTSWSACVVRWSRSCTAEWQLFQWSC